jgi:hypothetical protein
VSRARKYFADGRRTPARSEERRRLLEAFIGAAQKGRSGCIGRSLRRRCSLLLRWRGVVRTAARAPVSGRERAAKFIASFDSYFWTGMTLEWVETNGQASRSYVARWHHRGARDN